MQDKPMLCLSGVGALRLMALTDWAHSPMPEGPATPESDALALRKANVAVAIYELITAGLGDA